MKREVVAWSIKKLCELQDAIEFPTYQREGRLWSLEANRLLIDSIFIDIDIPKLYFAVPSPGQYEVVDGQQRIWAIWRFVEGDYTVKWDGHDSTYKALPVDVRARFRDYQLQVVEIADADEEYLRKLFLRLQLGKILVAGEKLHALSGRMRDFIFKDMALTPFITTMDIPDKRFARETLCAQMCVNSFELAYDKDFSRTRYDDLQYFFEMFAAPSGDLLSRFENQRTTIMGSLSRLAEVFGNRAKVIRNRSMALSVYLLGEDLVANGALDSTFPEFVESLKKAIDAEVKKGMDRTNEDLYRLEGYLSSAPGERYQIERRHRLLTDLFQYFKTNRSIRGT